MLTNFFKKVVLTGALVMAATPAFGGSFYDQYLTFDRDAVKSQCTDEQFKAIPHGKVNGILASDLTNQSDACVTRVLDNMSNSSQIMFVESGNTSLRQQSLTAAQQLQERTGHDVLIALYKDVDAKDNMQRVSFWADGHERGAYEIQEKFGINSIVLTANNAIPDMVEVGESVQSAKDLANKNQLAMQ
jgi:hypothetical protein